MTSGRSAPGQLEAAGPVARLGDAHPFRFEVDAAEEPDRGLVVDDEHSRHDAVTPTRLALDGLGAGERAART